MPVAPGLVKIHARHDEGGYGYRRGVCGPDEDVPERNPADEPNIEIYPLHSDVVFPSLPQIRGPKPFSNNGRAACAGRA